MTDTVEDHTLTSSGIADLSRRLVILLSHERSGSHFLADMLNSTGQVASVDEVCNFNAVDPYKSQVSYFKFRYECQLENLDFAYRLDATRFTELLDRYFLHLLKCGKKEHVLVDIKYGHVHNFEVGWWPSEHRPFLMHYLERRNVRIVHLVRQDSIAATVSAYVADQTRVWHKRHEDKETKAKKFRIPSQKIVSDALALEREKDNFFGWSMSNRHFQICYEDFAQEGARKELAMTELCEFMGLLCNPLNLVSSHKKVTPSLPQIVENYDDLRRSAALFGQGRLSRGAWAP